MSTTIRVPVARRARNPMTPTPVTNIARVESMNGAPRIAPTPTASVASPPPPNAIAMIGIIVSGSAVPTAASTEPTAPSASSSFRPNHSMPFVNSSAPSRMTTKAIARTSRSIYPSEADGGHDGPEDDEQDGERDEREPRVAGGEEPDAGDDDPAEWQREHRDEAQPQEPERVARGDLGGDGRQVERGHPAVRERVDPRREHQQDADEDQPHREVGAGDEQPRDRRFEAPGDVAGRGPGRVGRRLDGGAHRPTALMPIWTAVTSSTTTNSIRSSRVSIRLTTRAPTDAPTNTPSATGPAMYGSISSRNR